jgi:hypothetical protein
MNIKKAQSSIEFIILIGFVMTAFAIFFIVINESVRETTEEKMDLEVKEVALTIQNEIDLAYNSIEGYSRNFTLPKVISGKYYSVLIEEDIVFVSTIDEKHFSSFPIKNVTGQVSILFTNTISKSNGEVKITQ